MFEADPDIHDVQSLLDYVNLPLARHWTPERLASELGSIAAQHSMHLGIGGAPTVKQETQHIEAVHRKAREFQLALTNADEAAMDRIRRHYQPGDLLESVSYVATVTGAIVEACERALNELETGGNARDFPGLTAAQATLAIRLPELFKKAFGTRVTYSGEALDKTPAGRFTGRAWTLLTGKETTVNALKSARTAARGGGS